MSNEIHMAIFKEGTTCSIGTIYNNGDVAHMLCVLWQLESIRVHVKVKSLGRNVCEVAYKPRQ